MVVVACPLLPSASSTFQPSETGSGLHKDPIPAFTSHNRCSQYHRFELQKLFGLAGTQAPDLFLTLFSCLVETIAADKAKELPHGAWAQPTTKPTSPRSCHDHHVQAINFLFCAFLFRNNKPASILVNTFLNSSKIIIYTFRIILVEPFGSILLLVYVCLSVVPLQLYSRSVMIEEDMKAYHEQSYRNEKLDQGSNRLGYQFTSSHQ